MNDIENELRELFRERADAVVTGPSAPERVLRRGRRRQLGTVVLSSLVALSLVGWSIVGLRGLLGDRPGQGPAGQTSTRISSGDAYGLHWTLSSWVDDGRYCTRLRWTDTRDLPAGGSASCGGSPAEERATFAVTETESYISFVVALVPRDVVEVLVESEDARRFLTRGVVDAPLEWGALRFAVVPLKGGGPGTVHFIGAGHDIVHPSVGFRWGPEFLDATNLTHFATVPDETAVLPGEVTARIGSIELDGIRRTLFAWRETGTSKFSLYLDPGDGSLHAMAWSATAEGIEEAPLLMIGPLACDRRVGVLWGTVPGDVAAIEVLHRPGRIETIAGPPVFGDVRFVLGSLEEPYPGSAWLRFLDASGRPVNQDWLSGSCLERPPQPPEA
jgi:hypothetical protein